MDVLYYERDSYSAGKLYGPAQVIGDAIRLTETTVGQLGYYVYTPSTLSYSAFYIRFYFRIGFGNGADAVWLGLFDSDYNGTAEDVVSGGYHFTFDEYQFRVAFTKGTLGNEEPIVSASVSREYLMNYSWHLAEILFDRLKTRAVILLDGVKLVDATDSTPQSNSTQGVGLIVFGGRTGGMYNEHWVKDIMIIVNETGVDDILTWYKSICRRFLPAKRVLPSVR